MMWQMIWEFMKVGLFSVGGGLATLPFLYDISKRTGWFSSADISNMVAISESTPGPMGVNMASYVGYTCLGIPGLIIIPLALTFPSIVVVLIVSKVMDRFKASPMVGHIFYGVRAASLALVVYAGIMVARLAFVDTGAFAATGSITDLLNVRMIVLAAAIAVLYWKFKKLHPIVFIGIAAACGIIFGL